jgi:hypothetical protein
MTVHFKKMKGSEERMLAMLEVCLEKMEARMESYQETRRPNLRLTSKG